MRNDEELVTERYQSCQTISFPHVASELQAHAEVLDVFVRFVFFFAILSSEFLSSAEEKGFVVADQSSWCWTAVISFSCSDFIGHQEVLLKLNDLLIQTALCKL